MIEHHLPLDPACRFSFHAAVRRIPWDELLSLIGSFLAGRLFRSLVISLAVAAALPLAEVVLWMVALYDAHDENYGILILPILPVAGLAVGLLGRRRRAAAQRSHQP